MGYTRNGRIPRELREPSPLEHSQCMQMSGSGTSGAGLADSLLRHRHKLWLRRGENVEDRDPVGLADVSQFVI